MALTWNEERDTSVAETSVAMHDSRCARGPLFLHETKGSEDHSRSKPDMTTGKWALQTVAFHF